MSFKLEKEGNFFVEFIANGIKRGITLSIPKNYSFFAKKIKEKYPNQICIFEFGVENKRTKNSFSFRIREDLKDNHLNIDSQINGRVINRILPSNQEEKRLINFFLHTIKNIPKKLKIDIYFMKNIKNKKLLKTYNLKI